MTTIRVSLGNRSYPILVGRNLLPLAHEHVAAACSPTSVLIVTHPCLAALYAEPLICGLRDKGIRTNTLLINPGEQNKTLRTVARIYDCLVTCGTDRSSAVLALGGGVLGDTAGFAAATYLRGIPFIQAPTTLLSQVDASVGGKTGVDLPQGKNLVGAFHQPRLVLIDTAVLQSLPARELRSGLAEVIKYGIICDSGFFDRLSLDMPRLIRKEEGALARVIVKSCRLKADVVRQDETEQGLRAILNFGHTVGHALESVTSYRKYKHGEAISIGMVSAALIGEQLNAAPSAVTQRIVQVLRSASLPVAFPGNIDITELLQAMGRDKKAVGGKLRFVLAPEIGRTIIYSEVPESAIRVALTRQMELGA